jgi:hypothetical protein
MHAVWCTIYHISLYQMQMMSQVWCAGVIAGLGPMSVVAYRTTVSHEPLAMSHTTATKILNHYQNSYKLLPIMHLLQIADSYIYT